MKHDDDIPYLARLRGELVRAVARRQETKETTMARTRFREARGQRAALLAGAAAVVVAAVIGAVAFLSGGSSAPRYTTAAPGTELGGETQMSCVALGSLDTLPDREFAFDGTVTAIEGDRVTFEVSRWYRGGGGGSVTLVAPISAGGVTSVGGPDIEVGDRILGAGEEEFLWYCGFSMHYSEDNAELFEAAYQG
ncbi:MAG: hypothetical protein HY658_01735 [Actinobacteria bacterium]|nr:hypothetical protein [Actinomycetota bacterium]